MKSTTGIVIFLIGLFVLDCSAKPATDTDATNNNRKNNNNNSKNGRTAEEDSDMLMEPNEFSHVSVIKSEGQQIFPTTTDYEHNTDDAASTIYDSHSQAAQNFYPPFFRESPPLGHSRPYYAPDGLSTGKIANSRTLDQTILGSGDFGVIRGGTFYSDDDSSQFQSNEDTTDFSQIFGDSNNGHGRPQADAYVQKFTYPEEQFANFRDFAEINTPSDEAYSQFVVVYANKNTTGLQHSASTNSSSPKNIIEQLQLLDQEKLLKETKLKTSKTKEKLLSTKLEKKYKKKIGPKDLNYEPLLALS